MVDIVLGTDMKVQEYCELFAFPYPRHSHLACSPVLRSTDRPL